MFRFMCKRCNQMVRMKPILGGLHLCLTDEEHRQKLKLAMSRKPATPLQMEYAQACARAQMEALNRHHLGQFTAPTVSEAGSDSHPPIDPR